jgi:hypothetical protein
LILALVQLLPLPFGMAQVLSPRAAELWQELQPEYDGSEQQLLGFFEISPIEKATISLYPAATRHDLAGLAMATSVFALASLAPGDDRECRGHTPSTQTR